MEENTTTELQLSEEQLQAITGGGPKVEGSIKPKTLSKELEEFRAQELMARGHAGLHKIALETNFPARAEYHEVMSEIHSDTAKDIVKTIMKKQKNSAPGGPSGS